MNLSHTLLLTHNSAVAVVHVHCRSFSSFESCRYTPTVRICHPLGDGISSVVNLLDSVVLRVAIWLVAVVTCGGNVFVIVCRLLLQDETNSHSLFIKNLAGNLTGPTLFHFPECLLFFYLGHIHSM